MKGLPRLRAIAAAARDIWFTVHHHNNWGNQSTDFLSVFVCTALMPQEKKGNHRMRS